MGMGCILLMEQRAYIAWTRLVNNLYYLLYCTHSFIMLHVTEILSGINILVMAKLITVIVIVGVVVVVVVVVAVVVVIVVAVV